MHEYHHTRRSQFRVVPGNTEVPARRSRACPPLFIVGKAQLLTPVAVIYPTIVATGIEWTDVTWNPNTGCDRVSPGCDNCYALTLAARLKKMGSPRYQRDGDPDRSGPGFGLTLHQDKLDTPLSWKKPRFVFVNSMSDLFHERVPVGFIQRVFDTCGATPQHTYQILTKRHQRMVGLASRLEWHPNIWMGVSVESARYAFRVDALRGVPAAGRFVSAEPILGALDGIDLTGVGWVIAGGESGAGARPVDRKWVTGLRDLCDRQGIPFFFKQWGGRRWNEGGCELDGISHKEFPVEMTARKRQHATGRWSG